MRIEVLRYHFTSGPLSRRPRSCILKSVFIANVTEITASSPHVFKIQSQTGPIFALAFLLFKGQTVVNAGQCVL